MNDYSRVVVELRKKRHGTSKNEGKKTRNYNNCRGSTRSSFQGRYNSPPIHTRCWIESYMLFQSCIFFLTEVVYISGFQLFIVSLFLFSHPTNIARLEWVYFSFYFLFQFSFLWVVIFNSILLSLSPSLTPYSIKCICLFQLWKKPKKNNKKKRWVDKDIFAHFFRIILFSTFCRIFISFRFLKEETHINVWVYIIFIEILSNHNDFQWKKNRAKEHSDGEQKMCTFTL